MSCYITPLFAAPAQSKQLQTTQKMPQVFDPAAIFQLFDAKIKRRPLNIAVLLMLQQKSTLKYVSRP